jgi:hypothetical protein
LAQSCRDVVEFWRDRHSLSEAADEAASVVDPSSAVDSDGDADLRELYARLYRENYGRDCWNPDRAVVYMVRAAKLCEDRGIDLVSYVSAQMHGMKPGLERLRGRDGQRIGFQPNMLLGERAMVRYRVFAHAAESRHEPTRAFAHRTVVGKVVIELTMAELHIGSDYVYSRLRGFGDWGSAISKSRPGVLWMRYSHGNLANSPEYVLARLRAACVVCNRLVPGLADRIGFDPPFRWSALAVFLCRYLDAAPRVERPPVSGTWWNDARRFDRATEYGILPPLDV